MSKCPKHGIDYYYDDGDCWSCKGTGEKHYTYTDFAEAFGVEEIRPCVQCDGTGELEYPVCDMCDDEIED